MLVKFDQVHPQTALRSAAVIGGWGIYMLSIVPKAYPYTEIYTDNIDKEVFFKFLVISKDITLMGRFLN